MTDAADQLAQALRDLIEEAVQAAFERERPAPRPARVVEHPKVPDEQFDLRPWCNKKNMRHLMPVKEARQQLGGIGIAEALADVYSVLPDARPIQEFQAALRRLHQVVPQRIRRLARGDKITSREVINSGVLRQALCRATPAEDSESQARYRGFGAFSHRTRRRTQP